MYITFQNSAKAPSAQTYVETLFDEVPSAKDAVSGKLAIVTGVTQGGTGYYMAEELALSAEMGVILMGRSSQKLQDAAQAMTAEAKKRGKPNPKLYQVQLDLNSLKSAVSAAEEASKIAKEDYGGKVHILINNAGVMAPKYEPTEDGIEPNVGRNFLAPHMLTDKLLPPLRAAATESYKPRIVFVASMAHAKGGDIDPDELVANPAKGGGPECAFKKVESSVVDFTGFLSAAGMYSRSKFGNICEAIALAKREPKLNVTSHHPGSVLTNFRHQLGLSGAIYFYLFYMFQFGPSQGARAALRAALDPDFNTDDRLQGAYLHADGNPWVPADPTVKDPLTNEPYTLSEFAEKIYIAAHELSEKLVK